MANPIATGFRGLLDTGMLGDIGTGLLASSGYSPTPISLGQAFGGAMQYANQREAQKLEMSQLRNKIAQDQQRQKAMTQLQGLMQPGTTPGPVMVPTPAAIQTPEGRNQAMGLLGIIAPEQVASGLLASMNPQDTTRLPAEFNAFAAMRPDLQIGSPEFYAEYQKFSTQQQVDPIQAQLAAIELQNAQTEAQALIEQRAQTQAAAVKNTRTMTLNVNNSLDKLANIADAVTQLEGTWLETGLPAGDLRRGAAGIVAGIQSLAGKDKSKADALKATYDQLGKDLSDFTLDTASGFSNGALTDSKLSLMQQGFASLKTSPAANLHIVGETMRNFLDAAEIDGIEIRNADKYRELANTLLKRHSEELPAASELSSIGGAQQPAEIGQLEQELSRLDALIQSLQGQSGERK